MFFIINDILFKQETQRALLVWINIYIYIYVCVCVCVCVCVRVCNYIYVLFVCRG